MNCPDDLTAPSGSGGVDPVRDSDPLVVPARFRGPDNSGNGGWVSGALAARMLARGDRGHGAAVTVTLRTPPPLDRPLTVVPRLPGDPGAGAVPGGVVGVDLMDEGGPEGEASAGAPVLVASAVPAEPLPPATDLPEVTSQQVAAAEQRFPGLVRHVYPHCYGCGIERTSDEAVALRPGPVAGLQPWWAASWTPHEVTVPIVWAALDCPTGWAAGAGDRYLLLGRMTASVSELPSIGVPCTVLARRVGGQGRKSYAESYLCLGGRVLAQAYTVWIDAGSPR